MKISKVSENKYRLFWEMGYSETTGKRKQRTETFNGSRKASEVRWRAVQAEIDRGIIVDPQNMRFGELLDRWVNDVLPISGVEKSTIETYRNRIRIHIRPALGHHKLSSLSPIHLQAFYKKKLTEENLASATVNFLHTLIKTVLGQAVSWDLVSRNVAKKVKPPKSSQDEMKVWTAAEASIFLDSMKEHRLYALFLLALTTGMRHGEVLGLRWQDVNFVNKEISVQKSLSPVGKLGEPKTRASRRVISITQDVVIALQNHRKKMLEERLRLGPNYKGNTWDLVFVNKFGSLIYSVTTRIVMNRYIEKSGVSKIRFHDLRHTSATLMLSKGINPKVVSERLGHTSVAFTMQKYAHVLPHMQQEAADILGELLHS